MKKKLTFYLIIGLLILLDSVLITSPNLLGKIGLFIYKYHYLRTFPRTLLTVSLVAGVALTLSEVIHLLVSNKWIKRTSGFIVLLLLLLLSIGVLIKTNMDFSAWTYSHTGAKFRYGAYLLSLILIIIFTFGLITLPDDQRVWPPSSSGGEEKKEN